MATGRTNSGEVTITQSGGGGSSDVQPRKVDYIWMHPSSIFKIEKDFLGWLNSGYEISVQWRPTVEILNMSSSYTCIYGCKFNDSTYPFNKTSYGYYLGNQSATSATTIYRSNLFFCANLSNSANSSQGSYRNSKLLLRVNNNGIQYKNCSSYDYSYDTWIVPSSWNSLSIPDNNTFSSLLDIYDTKTGLRDFFGYGGLLTTDRSFYSCDSIIGNLKVTNPSNNEVICNYETWINNNTPYLKETVSNTTLNALWSASVQEADRFNGWIEYVTDENGIVTRKEVPPKKYVQTRGNITYVDEIEDRNENNGQNENIVAEEIDYPREENQR